MAPRASAAVEERNPLSALRVHVVAGRAGHLPLGHGVVKDLAEVGRIGRVALIAERVLPEKRARRPLAFLGREVHDVAVALKAGKYGVIRARPLWNERRMAVEAHFRLPERRHRHELLWPSDVQRRLPDMQAARTVAALAAEHVVMHGVQERLALLRMAAHARLVADLLCRRLAFKQPRMLRQAEVPAANGEPNQ
jgi:hypothetical protein